MEVGLGNLPTNGPKMFTGSNKLSPLETHKSNKSNMFPVVVGSRSLSFSMPFRWFFSCVFAVLLSIKGIEKFPMWPFIRKCHEKMADV